MSTDKNEFDANLKKNLAKDLIFRGVVWTTISMVAAFFGITQNQLTPIEYLEKTLITLAPMINTVGIASFILCLLAMAFKDIEEMSKNESWKKAASGTFGGLVRRLAGDVSLYTLGALIAMFSTMIVYCILEPTSKKDLYELLKLSAPLIVFFLFMAFANILVRREKPTPLSKENNKFFVYGMYFFSIVTLLCVVSIN